MTVAKHLRMSQLDAIFAVMVIHVRGKKLLDCNEMTLEEVGISSDCEVLCTLNIRGGSGSGFKSIPIQNLRRLLTAIRLDFDAWMRDHATYGDAMGIHSRGKRSFGKVSQGQSSTFSKRKI
jgi:hypothetical protein